MKRVRRINEHKPTKTKVNRVGENNPNWKGGVHKIGSYYYQYAPGHRKAVKFRDTPYVLRSTLSLEKKIGRKLRKAELPHHKDGNKANDNLRNLEVMTNADHRRHHSQGLSNDERARIKRTTDRLPDKEE
ncbi:MAG: HNH endonuclease [bacterium]|nr:HNH endonuclease [bacterium]